MTASAEMTEGVYQTLTCAAGNGYPEATVEWLLGGIDITSAQTLNILNNNQMKYTTINQQRYLPRRADNNKVLACVMTRMALGEPVVMNASIVLDVKCELYHLNLDFSMIPSGKVLNHHILFCIVPIL